MRQVMTVMVLLALMASGSAQVAAPRKVFISVDMEGISGVVNWEEVDRNGKDYDYFRGLMTKEASAAVEGAVAWGATEIVVRDSHGSARNILPEELHPAARLLRDWSGGCKGMMEGIDETFAAVVFIGYHAKAGTPHATLEHTMSGTVTDLVINGLSLPEAGFNALIAGYYNVPVVFVAGDQAICNQLRELLGNVETVAVKEGIGNAAICLHPEVARDRIRQGVMRALQNLALYKPFKLKPPYTMVLRLKREELVHEKSLYPGAKRTGDWELTFTSNDLFEVVKAFNWMH